MAFVPGADDLRAIPALHQQKEYREHEEQRAESTEAGSVYRNTSLFEALTAALDHVQSRQYGEDYRTVVTPFLRHDIELAFEKAMRDALTTHGALSTTHVDITTTGDEEAGSTFPLYRCDKSGTWTMVVRNARITVCGAKGTADTYTIDVDFLKVNVADGRPPDL
eukprot:Rhum_TRINITY_DN2693_c0_g1::Rhum_TRINITY_DN2693_c0_g1_i1::g.7722::m.7722